MPWSRKERNPLRGGDACSGLWLLGTRLNVTVASFSAAADKVRKLLAGNGASASSGEVSFFRAVKTQSQGRALHDQFYHFPLWVQISVASV